MKVYIKYIGLLFLIVFSFYYTDKISMMMIYKSDLMQEIISKKNEKEVSSIDAIINGEYIVPGLNGLRINELDSYYKMKKDYTYVNSKLVFYEEEPRVSIEDNKNLIINRANKKKKGVSIIIDNNKNIEEYAVRNKLNINKLITYNTFNKKSQLEQLNNEVDSQKLDILLDKYKLNNNICLINDGNKNYCVEHNKFLVKETYYIDNETIIDYEVTSGDILLISDNLSLSNFKILLKKINYRNIDIKYLSELISEKR